ncbi:YciI family protein [Nocardia sp. NRRL WC-3656]|uniref:YciI family protein n=1 Tax=Nocardia sp. NRRL WC-3656 TaxID=1463824 RepID=UPI0004C33DCF|nr:YciI family protein [Nocardia sp. NRRL WC-3656]
MPEYLLSIYQPDSGAPDAETMDRIVAELHRLNEELRESGSWVFTGGLHAADSATVVRADGLITDGPYLEGKEHIGGIWVITAADLDAALAWGRKAAAATTLPIEIRPFRDVPPF